MEEAKSQQHQKPEMEEEKHQQQQQDAISAAADHHHHHAAVAAQHHDHLTPVRYQQEHLCDERPDDAVGGSKFVHRGHPKPIDIGITRSSTGSVRGKYPFGN